MLRPLARLLLGSLAMTAAAALAELVRAWPGVHAGVGLPALVAVQAVALSAIWTVPLSGILLGAGAAAGRLWPAAADGPGRDLTLLPLLPPALLACVTFGERAHAWSARAFVRQDLAAAVVPGIELAGSAAIFVVLLLARRALRRPLSRLPASALIASALFLAAAALALHLSRFPELLADARVPALLEGAAVAAVGIAAMFAAPARFAPGPGRRTLAVAAGAWLALLSVMAFGGRIAPLSYPVATAAIQSRGLGAAFTGRLTAQFGDRDGDGYSRWFGGLDCDDGDPGVNPLAKDLPGDGIDQDCFEGDLPLAAVEADRAARAAQARPPRARAKNVVLITVDALRSDAVGFGGAKQPTSPALDRVAARATVFHHAYSQAPATRRSFPALLAGRYPSNIHWVDLQTSYAYPVSGDDNLYLAEWLRDHGVQTGMVVPFGYARNSRFDQGFAQKKEHPASRYPKETNADAVVDDAIAMLRGWAAGGEGGGDAPRFFLWVHFYEAHYPYERHHGIDFGDSPHARYLGEVRWIDSQAERLLATLDELGLASDTAIVITGDHGEEFGEHGGRFHGDLFIEDLHVPLAVAVPGVAPGALDVPVGVIDIAPTIAELLGVPIPPEFDGDSLLPWIERTEPPPSDRAVLSELIPDRKVTRRELSLIEARWHFVADFQLGARELYDLVADPTEQRNVLAARPAEAERLERRLRRFLALRVGPLRITPGKK